MPKRTPSLPQKGARLGPILFARSQLSSLWFLRLCCPDVLVLCVQRRDSLHNVRYSGPKGTSPSSDFCGSLKGPQPLFKPKARHAQAPSHPPCSRELSAVASPPAGKLNKWLGVDPADSRAKFLSSLSPARVSQGQGARGLSHNSPAAPSGSLP